MRKRHFVLMYVLGAALIISFIFYTNRTFLTNRNVETEVDMKYLCSDTWWNDEHQLSFDFYKDGTGVLIQGIGNRKEFNYSVNGDSITLLDSLGQKEGFNIVELKQACLSISLKGERIKLTHE